MREKEGEKNTQKKQHTIKPPATPTDSPFDDFTAAEAEVKRAPATCLVKDLVVLLESP